MKLDSNSFKVKSVLEYPYLYIDKLTDEMAVLIYSIPKGDLPIVTTSSGKLCIIESKNFDPFHLKLFIDLYKPCMYISKEKNIELENIYDYLKEVTNICLEKIYFI